jgi:hypothetical protein
MNFAALAAMEARGARYLKECGVVVKTPPPAEALLNNTGNAGILVLVVEEVLRAGGNKDFDIDELLESYVANVDDIATLRIEIIQAYNKALAPRMAARRAAPETENPANPPDETAAKPGTKSSKSRSQTSE